MAAEDPLYREPVDRQSSGVRGAKESEKQRIINTNGRSNEEMLIHDPLNATHSSKSASKAVFMSVSVLHGT